MNGVAYSIASSARASNVGGTPRPSAFALPSAREPWNKGKRLEPNLHCDPGRFGQIRTRLLLEGRARDLAVFNLAIDKLRV